MVKLWNKYINTIQMFVAIKQSSVTVLKQYMYVLYINNPYFKPRKQQ